MKRKGFTLIELLVVIAIIVLLVSILVPSLKKAKDMANRVACLTMQRAHGMNAEVYALDNKNIYPASADFNGGPMNAGYFSSFWLTMDAYYPGDATTETPEYSVSGEDRFDKSLEIYNYICPVYRSRFNAGELNSLISQGYWKIYPYLVGYETQFGNFNDPRNHQNVESPAWGYRGFGSVPKNRVGSCIGKPANQVGGVRAASPNQLVMFNDYGFFKNDAQLGDAHPGGWGVFLADGHGEFFEMNNPGLQWYEYPMLLPD